MWEFIDTKPFHDHLNSLRWLQKAASWLRWTAVGAPTWCFSTISWHNGSQCFLVSLKPSAYYSKNSSLFFWWHFWTIDCIVRISFQVAILQWECGIPINSRFFKLSFQIIVYVFHQKVCHLHNFIKYMLSGCLIKPCVSGLASNKKHHRFG